MLHFLISSERCSLIVGGAISNSPNFVREEECGVVKISLQIFYRKNMCIVKNGMGKNNLLLNYWSINVVHIFSSLDCIYPNKK